MPSDEKLIRVRGDSMISVKQSGDFEKTKKYLNRNVDDIIKKTLERYGEVGKMQLSLNTPILSGETAGSWSYVITRQKDGYTLSWHNNHMVDKTPLVILLQYGHATRSGGYVQGRDFINPAIRPVMDQIAADAWKEITKV